MKATYIVVFCLLSLKMVANPPDSTVAKLIDANLQVLTNYLDKKDNSLQKVSEAVSFFTELTGIASEADGTYYGQFHPSARDLDAWKRWFLLNKDYLFWDKEIQSVILYKKIKPSIL